MSPRKVNDYQFARFCNGERAKNTSLARVYVNGIAMMPYRELRACVTRAGIDAYWIKNFCFIRRGTQHTLEILAFEERIPEIVDLLSKAVKRCEVEEDFFPIDDPDVDLKTYAGTIKAQLDQLPEAMKGTRRELTAQLKEIQARISDNKALWAAFREMNFPKNANGDILAGAAATQEQPMQLEATEEMVEEMMEEMPVGASQPLFVFGDNAAHE